MGNKRNKARNHYGLQAITLCISTALVLILLGLIVFSVLSGRNLSSYVKENLVVTVMFDQDMTNPEAQQICNSLNSRPFIKHINYISKEQSLREATKSMGTNPAEFTNGVNPFPSSAELTASWSFIRRPFVRDAILLGLLAALIADVVLGGCIFALYNYEPEILNFVTWQVMANRCIGIPFRYYHHGHLRKHFCEQVPENEGRRTL
jgi:cell division protein FtsX